MTDCNKNLNEQLMHAIRTGNKKDTKELILSGANINIFDSNRTTVLMHVVSKGWEEILEILIQKNVDVNFKDLNDETAIKKAINNNITEEQSCRMIQKLIDSGANINNCDRSGITPLTLAAIHNQANTTNLLLENGASPNVQINGNKKTALMYAALKGNTDIAKALINKKAKINAQSKDNKTALHEAIDAGNIELAEMLLKEGANPNTIGGRHDPKPPLISAIIARDVGLTKKLVEDYNTDINIQSASRWSALSYAVKFPSTMDYMDIILKKNPIINTQTNTGQSPLMQAVSINEIKKVSALLKKQANPNLKNNEHQTALMQAVKLLKKPEIIAKELIKYGADPNIKDLKGRTALDIFKELDRDNDELITILTTEYSKIKAIDARKIEKRRKETRRNLRSFYKSRQIKL